MLIGPGTRGTEKDPDPCWGHVRRSHHFADMILPRRIADLFLTVAFAACGAGTSETGESNSSDPPRLASAEQAAFWSSLESMCGQAYTGLLIENEPPSPDFEGKELIMHVRECSENEIRVPFFVGDDRSRTWVFTPSKEGTALRLKHDHRHADGTEDEVTQYGGDTADVGTATSQSFPADAFTAELVPAAATNTWTVELVPGDLFAYQLRRAGTDRRFRVEFDLRVATDTPEPPWGAN